MKKHGSIQAIGPKVIPDLVYLQASPFTGSGEFCRVAGISRSVMHLWRKRYDFPTHQRTKDGSVVNTAALAEWLIRHGCEVRYI